MLILRRVKKIHFGEIFAFYLIWYGGVRIFIETMRTDPLTFEFLGMTFKSAIVTSVIMILAGIAVSVFVRLKRKDETYAKSKHTFNF
jgi:phosphatidylglycerol:prolipoprotein diacylglycerol transferase